ncbi:uncharacterized protein CANTADRAFT_55848, partial [Suhomyces tanzawaensis NRRL Y-17324]
MLGSQSVLSLCGHYVASVVNGVLEIAPINGNGPVHTHQLNDAIRRHVVNNGVEGRPRVSKAVVTQLEWEKVVSGASCAKIGVVIENYGLLMVYELHNHEPIVIQQSRDDGIEKFEWVPPVDSQQQDEDGPGGYSNSKQLVVFTKNYLHMKLYSLDCTHILLTIVKPLVHHLVVSPHRSNRIWSMVADTMEYNQPPLIYHFYNQGSTSTLFQASRLPQYLLTTPHIEWSASGRWLSLFTGEDILYGFDLKIFNLLGTQGPLNTASTVKPIFELNTMGDSKSIQGSNYPSTRYSGSWMSLQEDDHYVAISVADNAVELIFFSLRILRTISRVVK